MDLNEVGLGSGCDENFGEDSMSSGLTVELPPDWLKPMEEDEDNGAVGPKIPRKVRGAKVKRGRGRPRKPRNGITNAVDKWRTTSSAAKLNHPKKHQKAIIQSPNTTAQTDHSAQESPGASIPELKNPPRLTRASMLNADTSKRFVHSPSLKVGNVSVRTEPGQYTSELPLQLWLHPSLERISPSKIQSGGLPNLPEASCNGISEIFPRISECENCGTPFSIQKPGDKFCFKCRDKEEKNPSPANIVFKKAPKPKLKKEKADTAPDGAEEDEDDGLKKRNRRRCGQCPACLLDSDCGKCDFCIDKPKFGGVNKKRQKCRLRQCKFQSKFQFRRELIQRTTLANGITPNRKFKRQKKRLKRGRRKPWEKDYDDEEEEIGLSDEDDEELSYKVMGKKLDYSFKEENGVVYVEADIDADMPSVTEEDLYYNMSDSQDSSQVMDSAPSAPNVLPQLTDPISSVAMVEDMNQNGFLQIEMVRVGSPPTHFFGEALNAQQLVSGSQLEPTPVITQIFSLAATETESDRDLALMELFASLNQTVLPAHWIAVISRGPVIQLLQCSKLSNMADTVVQIQKGFFYQVSVQNQPLLLTHSIYSQHPIYMRRVEDVASLLLDLEGWSVCQGYPKLDMCLPWEPRMCVRAALCDLIIPKDQEHCGKCSQPVER
ncbi:hypothetical protein DNTS_011714 [Danionella cerebrum]|uniref:CXXC-type domain-containing protein n=1 Tax=Danionella cerebrum TaxID=2873325 RepID=A0A553QU66_9TELE|nr:hypothetical protein DNTS_011714 [Danionella translucida]